MNKWLKVALVAVAAFLVLGMVKKRVDLNSGEADAPGVKVPGDVSYGRYRNLWGAAKTTGAPQFTTPGRVRLADGRWYVYVWQTANGSLMSATLTGKVPGGLG